MPSLATGHSWTVSRPAISSNPEPSRMRKLSSVALATSLLALGACDDSTSAGDIFRREGVLDNSGSASVLLPREAGNPNRLPALSCYTAHPQDREWFLVASVEG